MASNGPYLTVVIPAYNEEARIAESLSRVISHLSTKPFTWEIIVANDGSSDGTMEAVRKLAIAEPRVRALDLRHGGKGWAVSRGMLASRAPWRFLCDADLSMPPEQIDRFLVPEGQPGYDIGLGSREAPGARRFNEPFRRHLFGRLFNRAVRILAVRGLDDTQCGFKMFRGTAADRIFRVQRLHGFGFDVEVLFLARKGRMKLAEIPIDWYFHGGSSMTFRKGGLAFLDILRVRLNDLARRYRGIRAPEGAPPDDGGR